MLPVEINLGDHNRGDTWDGIVSIGPILINGQPPPAAVASCKMQFRDLRTRALGYELNNVGGAGVGTITIVDANTWAFVVPPQFLVMDSGTYTWDFETISTAGAVKTYYKGIIKVEADSTYV